MKILADENMPRVVVEALRAKGHDVFWGRTDLQGAADDMILSRAQRDGRIVITFDKDFGELACRQGLPAQCGVVLFRVPITVPGRLSERIVSVLESRTDWNGVFAVVHAPHIRIRPLPKPAPS